MTTPAAPKLDRPGAGLPGPMIFIAKRLFAMKCRFGNRQAFLDNFEEERRAIRQLVDACPPDQRATRVLVPKLRGLEDSSRYYSVWMTLDHLRICNDAFGMIVTELAGGTKPDLVVRTEDVKPDPEVTGDVEAGYESSCDDFLRLARAAKDLKTPVQLDHPWFGPMNAYRWLALASMHMGIHRAQLAAILDGLPR